MFFETTRKVIRIYEILNGSRQHSHVAQALLSNYSQIQVDYQTLDCLIFGKRQIGASSNLDSLIDYRDYLKKDGFGQSKNLHLFEKVLFTLREESLDIDDIRKLPYIISLPILEIIRYARLFQQEIQTVPQWPDSLYKLI